jgi:hypothetical protein
VRLPAYLDERFTPPAPPIYSQIESKTIMGRFAMGDGAEKTGRSFRLHVHEQQSLLAHPGSYSDPPEEFKPRRGIGDGDAPWR